MTPSIRRSLLFSLLSAAAGLWLFALFATHVHSRDEIDRIYDAELAQSARTLLAFALQKVLPSHSMEDGREYGEPLPTEYWRRGHEYERNLAFQVWMDKEFLALRSENAPLAPFTSRFQGYSDVVIGTQRWRVFSAQTEDGAVRVQVGELYAERDAKAADIVSGIVLPTLIVLPALGLFIWMSVGRAMVPLHRIAQDMEGRKPHQLHPIDVALAPVEAKPLTDALNTLFDRLKIAFERERRFTADAAHELRTPLAAIKTQTEVALQAKDDNDKAQALRQVIRGVNRATHLVEQLLTLARLDPETGLTDAKRLDLFIIAENVLSDMAPAALEKNIEIGLSGTRGKFVRGHQDALAILLRNLVDNAIRYGRERGLVEVSITRNDNDIVMSVADDGPGIPEDERAKVFKRFYRRLGTKAPGSGLGLSIVSRITELHQLTIELDTSSYGGLQVDVRFAVDRGS